MSLNPTVADLVRSWTDAKHAAGGALVLLRIADFYETLHEDARTLAATCGLGLTFRNTPDGPMPMTGFMYHQLDGYLAKLIASGLRVAICDEVEKPLTTDEAYRLARPSRGKKKPPSFHSQPGLQKNLVDGLDALPGQLDLF